MALELIANAAAVLIAALAMIATRCVKHRDENPDRDWSAPAGRHQLAVFRRQGQHDKVLALVLPKPSEVSPVACHQQRIAKIQRLVGEVRRERFGAMANGQYG